MERLSAIAGVDSVAHLALARAYQNPFHDRENSLKHFNCALELSPDSAIIYSCRAGMYQEFGELDLALADADHALELDASCSHAHMVRGRS